MIWFYDEADNILEDCCFPTLDELVAPLGGEVGPVDLVAAEPGFMWFLDEESAEAFGTDESRAVSPALPA